jgi:glycine oxidase
MKNKKRYDAIVVGSGVAGLGAASALAESGKKVLILSKKMRGEASPASAGILDPFLEMKPGHPLFVLCREASRNYPAFIKKLGGSKRAGYEKTGMLYVAMNDAEERQLKKRFRWQKRTGLPVRWVSRQEVLKKNPDVVPEMRAGLFYPGIARVQPKKLIAAWVRYLKARGVRFQKMSSLPSLVMTSNKVRGVRAGRKFYEAPCVVNALGAWAGTRGFGVSAPVLPARGQILMMKGRLRMATILHSLDGGYVVPWGKNRYLVGSNVEFCGFKPEVTREGLRDILRRNERILPALRQCRTVETWAGLRPYSKKRIPWIGPSRIPGLYMAAGYYRSGILISAAAGKLLAKAIISGKMPPLLKPFQMEKA